jgi:hypothetical protein
MGGATKNLRMQSETQTVHEPAEYRLSHDMPKRGNKTVLDMHHLETSSTHTLTNERAPESAQSEGWFSRDVAQIWLAFLALDIGLIFGVFSALSWQVTERARTEANDSGNVANGLSLIANQLSLLQYCAQSVCSL